MSKKTNSPLLKFLALGVSVAIVPIFVDKIAKKKAGESLAANLSGWSGGAKK